MLPVSNPALPGVCDPPQVIYSETTRYSKCPGAVRHARVDSAMMRATKSCDEEDVAGMRNDLIRPGRAFALLCTVTALVVSAGCTSSLPNRDPTGESFPAVSGQSLEEETIELPAALAGEPAILLIGYEQDAQFDIDRWLMGLVQSGAEARILELPTIPGLVGRIASGWIDDGMRSGIPREDWSVVVTLYGSAAQPLAELTGTTNGQLARVLVLDADGKIVWFDDRGYAVRKALTVSRVISELRGASG